MIEHRIEQRTQVRLDITVATVVNNGPGTVTDISETGAKIMYPGTKVGERVSIIAFDQDIYGTVAWADPDRFGMKFDQRLSSGPLHGFLQRMSSPLRRIGSAAPARPVFGRRAA